MWEGPLVQVFPLFLMGLQTMRSDTFARGSLQNLHEGKNERHRSIGPCFCTVLFVKSNLGSHRIW